MIRIESLRTGEKKKTAIANGTTIQTRGLRIPIVSPPIRINQQIHIGLEARALLVGIRQSILSL